MKKALTITIAGTLFTIEEDAYQKLDVYLKSIQNYFGTSAEGKEIIEDIEARIAEQLLENKTVAGVVTIEAIEKLMTTMGSVEDFGDKPESTGTASESSNEDPTASRKLYRDTDDVVIAGVASGIAHYIKVDPLFVRLGFIVLTLITSGFWIVLYIILALIVPKAETAAEKMQQRGGPVTLSSFKETIKKNSEEYMQRSSKLRTILERLIRVFGKIVVVFVKIIIGLIAISLIAGALFGLITATFTYANLIFNSNSTYVGFPITEVIGGLALFGLSTFYFIAVAIPLIVIALLGVMMIRRKKVVGMRSSAILAGVWALSLIMAGTLSVKYIPQIHDHLESMPENQRVTETQAITQPFTKLDLNGFEKVKFVQASTTSIVEEGRRADVDETKFEVKDGTLTLQRDIQNEFCLFCDRDSVDIIISAPFVDRIDITDNIRFQSDDIRGEKVTVVVEDVARADMKVDVRELVVITQGVARAHITGTSTSMGLTLEDASRFEGDTMNVRDASVKASGVSRAYVHVDATLHIDAEDVSRVEYTGTAEPTIIDSDNARVERMDAVEARTD
ncbi:MAG: DUF2807 domain-containing protein [Patescibacteria group bacterium]